MENNLNITYTNKVTIKWDAISNTGYIYDLLFVESLRNNYKIIAEPIGTPKTSRRQNKILTKPFVLSKFETFYLHEK